jgi:hypothetical protein
VNATAVERVGDCCSRRVTNWGGSRAAFRRNAVSPIDLDAFRQRRRAPSAAARCAVPLADIGDQRLEQVQDRLLEAVNALQITS